MASDDVRLIVKGRLMWGDLFEARAFNDAKGDTLKKPAFSATLAFDEELRKEPGYQALAKTVKEMIAKFWPEGVPDRFTMPIRKGDMNKDTTTGKVREGYAGTMYIRAKSYDQPQVIDQGKNPITDPQKVPNGYYIRASITIQPYGHNAATRKWANGGTGIRIKLGNVQLVAKGERFDGRKQAVDEFDEITDGGSVQDADDLDFV